MKDGFEFADDLGPARVIHVYQPGIDLRGVVVVDNVAAGPSIGGLRMAPDVSTRECFRLARAMTLKNAAAGLPHGGGKSVIYGDPKADPVQKEARVRAFACALRGVEDYIFGPDMGTDEASMAWVRDEIGRAVGLPRELGGIPLDEIGATGWGVRHAAEVAAGFRGLALKGARVVVQGFGAVGRHAARFLAAEGAVLVAASDSGGATWDPDGLDVEALIAFKDSGGPLSEYPGGRPREREAVIDIECEIWIPAARPDVITEDNAHRLKTRLVVEGANIPVTAGAEKVLRERDVLCVPDFIANAGGVICAAMEYRGASQAAAMAFIEEKVQQNTEEVLATARDRGLPPRQAAEEMALERVRRAMGLRRWGLWSGAPGAV